MKSGEVRLDWQNRMFVQDIIYGPEDGMPEGYTLYLEHTAKPEDPPQGTVYKDGDWGCWGCSPQKLIIYHEEKQNGTELREEYDLETIEHNGLRWLDIYDGIIVYSSSDYRNENFVLYNVLTKAKKTITADDYVGEDWEQSFDHVREPMLWVQDGVVYVQFDAVDGWYDGGEEAGSRIMYFKKDTLEQLKQSECHLDGYLCDIINQNRGKDYGNYKSAHGNINLYPDCFDNKYGKKSISTMCHEIQHGEHKYPEFPKSLIKQMKKLRLAYAAEIGADIEPYSLRSPFCKDIWERLYDFCGKLRNWAFAKHLKSYDKRRDRAIKRAERKKKK